MTDDNDFAPVCLQNVFVYTVDEEQAPPSDVTSGDNLLECTDNDATPAFSALTYTIADPAAAALFEVVQAGEGVRKVVTKVTLDRETLDRYEFNVTVSDGVASDSLRVNVMVMDVEDSNPEFLAPQYVP